MSKKSRAKHLTPRKSLTGSGVPPVDFVNDPKPRYVAQPRVFCTLHPETGQVQIELAGSNGYRQLIEVKNLETIRQVLLHQAELARAGEPVSIGMTADPTEAQIRHWEDHSKRGRRARLQSNCPFCIAEAKAGVAPVSARKFDTRGNPIRTVTDPSQLGF